MRKCIFINCEEKISLTLKGQKEEEKSGGKWTKIIKACVHHYWMITHSVKTNESFPIPKKPCDLNKSIYCVALTTSQGITATLL